MSRHRAEPPRRRRPAPHRHAVAQPRYGRIGAAAVSATVCLVALLGGFGVLPSVAGSARDSAADRAADRAADSDVARDLTGTSGLAAVGEKAVLVLDSAQDQQAAEQAGENASENASQPEGGQVGGEEAGGASDPRPPAASGTPASADDSLPADSGEGYRVVFSESRQRVWLVDDDNEVVRTYLVSGSVYDNLDPGTFEVYSRSEQAYAFDGSGSMKYFVRFAQGDTGAAIGFHDIPVDNDGDLVQTLGQLGTPRSHGCIRQEREDAIALWDFTEIGTTVVVV